MADKNIYWSKTALTGGGATALDSIDGAALQDGEIAHVWISNVLYIYLLDVDSGAAEASPTVITPDTNAGNKRWILQGVRTINVGSDADGDMYYRASSVLARLAKGTADYKLFMNAGATAPEWANGMKVITSTRALDGATGEVAYTGAGFKPSGLIALAQIDGQDKWCIGMADGVTAAMISRWGSTSYLGSVLMCIYDADVAKNQTATIKSYDSNGVTLTWTRNGATGAGTIKFALMCFR